MNSERAAFPSHSLGCPVHCGRPSNEHPAHPDHLVDENALKTARACAQNCAMGAGADHPDSDSSSANVMLGSSVEENENDVRAQSDREHDDGAGDGDEYDEPRIGVQEVPALLAALGHEFAGVRESDVTRFTAGMVGQTFGVRSAPEPQQSGRQLDLVLKVNADRRCLIFGANRLVSDYFARDEEMRSKVVQVLAYDARERTPHETLVMRRSEGRLLIDDLLTIARADLEAVVRDALRLLRRLYSTNFEASTSEHWDWGEFCEDEDTRPEHQLHHCVTNSAYNLHLFLKTVSRIRERRQKDEREVPVTEQQLEQLERYFREHVHVFDDPDERPVFIHTDVHWANILYHPAVASTAGPGSESGSSAHLSALIDYDFCVRGVPLQALPAILGMIREPSSIIESEQHPNFKAFTRLDLSWLVPVVREELPELCALGQRDLRRLNLIYIRERLPYANARGIERLLREELLDDEHLADTLFARMLRDDYVHIRDDQQPETNDYRTPSPC